MTLKHTTTVHFFDILGGRFTLGPQEYLGLLRSKTTQTYLAVVYVLLLVTDAPGLLGTLSIVLILPLWVVVMGTFMASVWMVVAAMAYLQTRVPVQLWPGPAIVVLALTPSVLAGETLTYLFTDGALGFDLFPRVLFYWLIAEMFGLIFFRYVRTQIEYAGASADAQPSERHVVIGAEPVELSRLRHIEARAHHVYVTLDGENLTQRARLSDIVAQTGPEDGLQPHRSWWVAAHAAKSLTRDGARHVLHLDDGTQIPVARSRVNDVRAWLDRRV